MATPRKSYLAKELLLDVGITGPGDPVDLGSLSAAQSAQAFGSDPDTEFEVTLEASLDGEHWVPFGTLNSNSIRSEGQMVVQFVRANVRRISGGTVTVLLASASV